MTRRPAFRSELCSAAALLLLFLVTACSSSAPAAPATTAVPLATATAIPTVVPSPPPSPTTPFTPTTAPTLPPTTTPTPPPPVPLTLVVPETLFAAAQAAVNTAEGETLNMGYRWQVRTTGTGDAHLQQDAQGLAIGRLPVALAVPFTSRWEAVSLAEAEAILAGGHELVAARPWNELARGQKALRIDGRGPADPDYPLQQTWSLVAGPELGDVAAALQPHLQEAWPRPPVHLLAVGDIMLDRSLGAALERGDLAYPFAAVAPALRGADLTVGNVESALGDTGEPQAKRYPFRAPPAAAAALSMAGFDVVSLANNHALDYGPEALLQALNLLATEGVQTVGAGPNHAAAHSAAVLHRQGLDIAFLSYVHVPVEAVSGFDTASWTAGPSSPGLAWAEPQQIKADVSALRDQVDLVIVLLHSGYEYQAAPSDPQRAAAYAAIDGGADLVIGHHAHILQGIEWYKDGVIAYGTANFAFEIDGDPETALFHFWLDENGVRELAVEPALVQFGGQPRLAEPWLAPAIRERIYALTDLLNP